MQGKPVIGETWRTIAAHPDYSVSDRGRVRRDAEKFGIRPAGVLAGRVRGDGYLEVLLQANGRKHYRLLHRLVLEAFIGPCPDGMECRHLDGNRANNCLENLAWGSRAENYRDRVRHGTDNSGERNGLSRLTAAAVAESRRLASVGVSTGELAKRFGVTPVGIADAVRGKTWAHVPGALQAMAPGERRSPRGRLRAEDYVEIRRRVASGERHRVLAEAFGVSRSLVSMIASGRVARS